MKSSVKKMVAVAMASSMVLSLASCSSSKANDEVIDAADSFASAVCKQDTKKILKATNMKEKDFPEELFVYDSYVEGAEIKLAILEELSYEIDEESVEASSKDGDASIDVIFSLPDYDKVFDETEASSEDELIKELGKADKKEIKVTVEFELDDEDWVVSNGKKVLDKVFADVHDASVPSFVNLDDIEYEWYFEDEEDGHEAWYSGTSYIEVDIYNVDYSIVSYRVERDGKVLYQSDKGYTYGAYSDYEGAELTPSGMLPAGDYSIIFTVGNKDLDPFIAHVEEGEISYTWYFEDDYEDNEAWYTNADYIEVDLDGISSDVSSYEIKLDGKVICAKDGPWASYSEYEGAELIEGCLPSGDYVITFYINGEKFDTEFTAHVTNTLGDFDPETLPEYKADDFYWYFEDDSEDTEAWYVNTDAIDVDFEAYDCPVFNAVYYTVEIDGKVVYEANPGSDEGYFDEYVGAEMTDDGYMVPGDYTIKFYYKDIQLGPDFTAHVSVE